MNRILEFFCITIFSIFLGSQITEGFLLVPYWKSLSTPEFYEYYSKFGLVIGKFYTILTVFAALIPICISIYCLYKKSQALRYSLIASFFTFLFIALFYIYFKNTNQQFYDAILNTDQLKSELKIWDYWHWRRVFFEFITLIFLNLTFKKLTEKNSILY
jgi:glycopeptide antibiotics resistance protein